MVTRTPTPHARALWQEVVDARRAEFTARRADSREHRRADDRHAWAEDIRHHFARALRSVMLEDALVERLAAAFDVPVDLVRGEVVDPRAALVDLLAAASAWVDAMDGRGAVE